MTDWTGEGTEVGASSTVTIWTPTTLAEHLRGEIDADPDAAGGDVPNRLLDAVQAAYRDLWEGYCWRFRRRRTTLTVATGTAYADLPADFEQFDMRWLQEANDDAGKLTITLDEEVFESHRESYDDTTGNPQIAIVEPADDLTGGYSEVLRVSPPARQEFTFDIVYFCVAPALENTASPIWPQPFHSAWEFIARSRIYYDYRPEGKDPDKVWRHARGIVERLVAINDRTTRTGVQRIRDTVGDLDALGSQAWARGGLPVTCRNG